MKNILILIFTFSLSAPLFAHGQNPQDNQSHEKESHGAITREAKKVDSKIKNKLNKVKKDVNAELCSTGEEQCTIPKKTKKSKKSSLPANRSESNDQAD